MFWQQLLLQEKQLLWLFGKENNSCYYFGRKTIRAIIGQSKKLFALLFGQINAWREIVLFLSYCSTLNAFLTWFEEEEEEKKMILLLFEQNSNKLISLRTSGCFSLQSSCDFLSIKWKAMQFWEEKEANLWLFLASQAIMKKAKKWEKRSWKPWRLIIGWKKDEI